MVPSFLFAATPFLLFRLLFYFQLVLTHTENFSSSFLFFLRGFSEIDYLFTKFSIKNTSQQKKILYICIEYVHQEGCFSSDFVAFVFYSLILHFLFSSNLDSGLLHSICSKEEKSNSAIYCKFVKVFNLFFLFLSYFHFKNSHISLHWLDASTCVSPRR